MATVSSGSQSQWVLKPVRGEGREHRLETVKAYLKYLYAGEDTISRIEDGSFKCRILYDQNDKTERALAILIHRYDLTNRYSNLGFKDAIDIKVLTSLDHTDSKKSGEYLQFLLKDVKEAGKLASARSLFITLPRVESLAHQFFLSEGFLDVTDRIAFERNERLLGLHLNQPAAASHLSSAPPAERKRHHEEETTLSSHAKDISRSSSIDYRGEEREPYKKQKTDAPLPPLSYSGSDLPERANPRFQSYSAPYQSSVAASAPSSNPLQPLKRKREEDGFHELVKEANQLIPPEKTAEESNPHKKQRSENTASYRSSHDAIYSGYDLPGRGYPSSQAYAMPSQGDAAAASRSQTWKPAPPSQSYNGVKPLGVTLRKIYIHSIRDGRKTIEGRVNSGMFSNLAPGRLMRFFYFANVNDDVTCKVVKINRYASFREMVTKENFKTCVPEATSIDHAARLYEEIPGYVEKAQRFGVLAIHLEKV
jgi:ASC-1-like (ASCH) protein